MLLEGVEFLMRKNSFLLDKFSSPTNHPLFISMVVYKSIKTEVHINELIKRILKSRKMEGNSIDEARIIKSISLLVLLGLIDYYKGFVFRKK